LNALAAPNNLSEHAGLHHPVRNHAVNDWFEAEEHVERAHEAFQDGRWEEAESELRRALELNPHRAEWHFNLGLTLEAAGRFQDASSAFSACHDLDDGDPHSALCAGVNLLRADDPRGAIAWFERAQRADPKNAMSYVHRIEAFSRLGDHDQAEVMFYLAQQVDPRNALAHACLADSLLSRGQSDRALWCLREAAHLDPRLPGVHARLAQAYASSGRLERARQLFLRELRQDPGDIETLLDLGILLIRMNRVQEAEEKFRRVLEMEPDNADAHFQLADLSLRMGRADEAAEQYSVVLRLEPEFPGVRRRLAATMLSRGSRPDTAAARELLRDDLEAWRQRPERFADHEAEDLGIGLLDAGMAAEAREVLGIVSRHLPTHIPAMHHLSVACFTLGDRSAGLEICKRILKCDPRFVPAMHNMAVAYVYDRQWKRARYWVAQALRVDPDDPSLKRLRIKLALHTAAEAATWAVRLAALIFLRRRIGASGR
jgi:tetratricopeptide (TPR) repeat protein